jgi:Putative auto-transporter adhesin, head GIN domain
MDVFKNKKIQNIDNQNINNMKTKLLSIVAIAAIVLGIGNATYAAKRNDSAVKNNEVSTVLTNVSAINKIEVHGNVELYVSDGAADQVKVYNRYYAESALVQSHNGVLRISSYSPQKLVVWITANDLRTISVYDNAEVKSFGKLSIIELNVDLHNNALAQLNLDAYSANVTVADHSKADLSGSANEFTLKHDMTASVNKYNFEAAHITENTNAPLSTKNADMAVL